MDVRASVKLISMEKEINRQIIFDSDISIKLFCEYVILSMNGNLKHLYQLVYNDSYTYLCDGCDIIDNDVEEMMGDKKMSDIGLFYYDYFLLDYDFKNDWEFDIEIKGFSKNKPKKMFEVVSGKGYGIIDDIFGIMELNDTKDMSEESIIYNSKFISGYEGYNFYECDINMINRKIDEYLENTREKNKPKRYELDVYLVGFSKEIKRKIVVNSNVRLYKLCEMIILSMEGNLNHNYNLIVDNNFIDNDTLIKEDLGYLLLKPKQKLKVIYDPRKDWTFNVTVSKIIDGYDKKNVTVVSGKGYGIIEECGGISELNQIFYGNNVAFCNYDINKFDIDSINRIIDIYY